MLLPESADRLPSIPGAEAVTIILIVVAILVIGRVIKKHWPIERCDHDGCMLTRLAEKQAELEKE